MKNLKELCEIIGIKTEFEIGIKALNSLEDASDNELSFCVKDNDALRTTKAAAVLIDEKLSKFLPSDVIAIVCDDPKYAFALLSKVFAKDLIRAGKDAIIGENTTIMPNVYIGKDTSIGNNCTIMAGAYIGDGVCIKDNVIIYPNVTIYNDSIIGNHCIIHAGSVIGSDGFGYASNAKGHFKIYHNGYVELQDFVEIGSCVCIDRAVFSKTLIKAGTKIDNLVQIGHNCILGQGCLVVSQTGLAGSSELGNAVVMGGQSATSGHLKIGDRAIIAARGGVSKDLAGGKVYGGFPIMEQREWLKMQAKLKRMNNEG